MVSPRAAASTIAPIAEGSPPSKRATAVRSASGAPVATGVPGPRPGAATTSVFIGA